MFFFKQKSAYDLMPIFVGSEMYIRNSPNSIAILEKNLGKVICWDWLSKNPNAIPILENNLDEVDWRELSGNPNAIQILEKGVEINACNMQEKQQKAS